MKSIVKRAAAALVVLAMLVGLGLFGVMPAYAVDCDPHGGIGNAMGCSKGEGQPETLIGNGGVVNTVINVMLFIVGILCVIMIIFAGIRYVTSAGDKGKVDTAKNTIVYSIVGLIVAIVAYALVNWVFAVTQG